MSFKFLPFSKVETEFLRPPHKNFWQFPLPKNIVLRRRYISSYHLVMMFAVRGTAGEEVCFFANICHEVVRLALKNKGAVFAHNERHFRNERKQLISS